MNDKLKQIYEFKCPKWEELPNNIFSSEIIEYFEEKFNPIFTDEDILTKSMIQNYVKWKMIPAPKGRKYSKEQIARIIVICIFKQVITIQDIVDGVNLQNKLMDIPSAYNILAKSLENCIKVVFEPLLKENKDTIKFGEHIAKIETLGIESVVISFVFKLLTKNIILVKGTKNLL